MWEDPEIERVLMQGEGARDILCVASAGDTAFHLSAVPGVQVTAFDINPAQIHLCELKQCLLEKGLLSTVWRDDAREAVLSLRLPRATRVFWKQNSRLLRTGVSRAGKVDLVMEFWSWLFGKLLVSPERLLKLLTTRDPKLRQELFQTEWEGFFWKTAFRVILHRLVLSCVYGRDFVALLPPDISERMRHRMEHFVTADPAADNPYLWQTFAPRIRDAPEPHYFRHFGAPRFQQTTLEEIAERGQRFDFIALSNILEVADPKQIRSTLTALKIVARPGALLVLRFMFGRPPVWPNEEL